MTQLYAKLDRLIQRSEQDWDLIIEALIDKFYADLLFLATTILRDPVEAEDVVQETLLIAMSKIHQYEPGTNLRAWIFTIAVNVSRGFYRKRKIRQRLNLILERGFSQNGRVPSPEEAVLQHEMDAHLWEAVNSLGEKHRLPIVLRYLHGLPCREIALILNVNEGTVRSRLHYGVRRLQGMLERDGKLPRLGRRKPK